MLEEIISVYTGIKSVQRSSRITREAFDCVLLDGFADSFIQYRKHAAGVKEELRKALKAGASQALGNPIFASMWKYFNTEARIDQSTLHLPQI